MKQTASASRVFAGIVAITAWLTVIVQLKIMLDNPVAPVSELLVRFFSFFTILSNIAVAACTSAIVMATSPRKPGQSLLSSVAVYIFIVSLVYNGILRFLWAPAGLARLVDESLHVLVPILYLIYWYLFVPVRKLPVSVISRWLLFPVLYLVFVLLRGQPSGFYPYPFIDVTKIGMQQALINALGVAFAFVLVSLLVWFIGNRRAAMRNQ